MCPVITEGRGDGRIFMGLSNKFYDHGFECMNIITGIPLLDLHAETGGLPNARYRWWRNHDHIGIFDSCGDHPLLYDVQNTRDFFPWIFSFVPWFQRTKHGSVVRVGAPV